MKRAVRIRKRERNQKLKAALGYAERGWKVLPLHFINKEGVCSCGKHDCSSPGKHPIGRLAPNGVHSASDKPEMLRSWWKEQPEANIGIATGETSGFDVIDVDPRNGGSESFDKLCRSVDLPNTLVVKTGGGGEHWYFQHSNGKLKIDKKDYPGIDFQSDGKYIVAPSSDHVSGNKYEFANSTEIQNLPQEFFNHLESASKNKDGNTPSSRNTGPIFEGERNTTLTSLAGSFRNQGLEYDELDETLQRINKKRCKPPLEKKEVSNIAKSISGYPTDKTKDDSYKSIGDRILGQYKIITDDNGNSHLYNGIFWEPLSSARLYNLTLMNDCSESKSTVKRRGEIKSYIEAKTYKGKIEWNNLNLYQIAVSNGVYNLNLEKLKPHQAENYLDTVLDINCNPEASCPTWDSCLKVWFKGNEDMIETYQRFWGYITMPGNQFKKSLFVIGEPDSGKTLCTKVLTDIIGENNVSSVNLNDLGKSRALAPIKGKKLNLNSEISENTKIAEDGFKRITGGDSVEIDPKFMKKETYKPSCKIMVSANKLPKVVDQSEAIFNRILIIPFRNTIPPEGQDRNLFDKLKEEREGILNWALRGAKKLIDNNGDFAESTESKAALNRYKNQANLVKQFLNECVRVSSFEFPKLQFSELYGAFLKWCKRNHKPDDMSRKKFSIELQQNGIKTKKKKIGYCTTTIIDAAVELI